MKRALSRFSVADIKRANLKVTAKSHDSGHSERSVIVLDAEGRTKTISTHVSSSQIKEAWAKVGNK